MASKKHYIITSLTLGAVAAGSAALIGVTNLVTKDQIVKNEKNKINAGIMEIYGKSATISQEFALDGYKYSEYAYTIKSDDSAEDVAIRTTGSNMYGKISLIVGFRMMILPEKGTESLERYVFVGLYIVTNEQTYASTLEENYIDPLNDKDVQLDDVSCGATYGAKLVRDMVNEAQEAAASDFRKGE